MSLSNNIKRMKNKGQPYKKCAYTRICVIIYFVITPELVLFLPDIGFHAVL